MRAVFLLALIGGLLASTAAGADGHCQNNIPASNPNAAYINHGNGTVTDQRTGLMWKQCVEGRSGSDCGAGSISTFIWANALVHAEAHTFAGHNDWRLPNIKELRSLADECRTNPAINTALFPNTPSSNVWSGSPVANLSDRAWLVSFGFGSAYFDFRHYYRQVRLVRGGQSFASFTGDASAVQAGSVTFLSENLPDGSYHVGTQTKTWRFEVGGQSIQGLKAVQVASDAGLGIQTTEIALGDVAAQSTLIVSLPIQSSHDGQAIKQSTWRLVDGANNPVAISNSASDTFWLKIRTNRPPVFSPLQLTAVGGRLGELVSLPVLVTDLDGDSLSYTVSGPGGVVAGHYQAVFDQTGVHEVTITASDGRESASRTIQVLIYDDAGVSQLFSDVAFSGVADPDSVYSAVHYLALNGIAIGTGGEGDQRVFDPGRAVYQAEALGMLLLAAERQGIIPLQPVNRELPNLITIDPVNGVYKNFTWAAPYAVTAEVLGLITDASDWQPDQLLSREELSRWLTRLLSFDVPPVLQDNSYHFIDSEQFSTVEGYRQALMSAFHGYLGELGGSFAPATSLSRGEMAQVVSRLMQRPTLEALSLDGTSKSWFQGFYIDTALTETDVSIVGVEGLHSQSIMQSAETIKEEWIDTPAHYVDISVYMDDISLLGTRRISQLNSSPIAIDTSLNNGAITEDYRHMLTVVLRNVKSGVATLYSVPLGISFPDRDGDGVRDDLDLWPDDWRFAFDSNNNGYPDEVDMYLTGLGVNPIDQVFIDGVGQGYSHGHAVMQGLPPYDGFAGSGVVSDVQIMILQRGRGEVVMIDSALKVGDKGRFQLLPASGYRLGRRVGGSCPQGEWVDSNMYETDILLGHCTVEFQFISVSKGGRAWLPAVIQQ